MDIARLLTLRIPYVLHQWGFARCGILPGRLTVLRWMQ